MTWEPMTEDAVFERGSHYLVLVQTAKFWEYHCIVYCGELGEQPENFFEDVGRCYSRSAITHFARITNPNKVKP